MDNDLTCPLDSAALSDFRAKLTAMLRKLAREVPNSTQFVVSGFGGVRTYARSLTRRNHVVPTQHVITNVLIDLDGDRATVGANLIATFVHGPGPSVPLFQRGERYSFEAVRTDDGWRLSRVESKPIWTVGSRDSDAQRTQGA